MRIITAAGAVLGVSLLLAACSGGGATTAPITAAPATAAPASEAPSSEAPSTDASASAPAASSVSVALGDTSLGSVLVDAAGKTLYIFEADTGGESVCYDECAAAWPPLLSDGNAPSVGAGLDAGDFATTDRTDGTKQVTFYGMPVYYFAADAAAGDTKGQGLSDKWWVVGADGTAIK